MFNAMSPALCAQVLMHNRAPLVGEADIVVRTGLTTVTIKQRVLARESTVFTRICKYAGSATSIVLDDDPIDLVRYINKIRAGKRGAKKPISVEALASLLRMGRKYVHEAMLREMATRVAREFPTTLEKWDSARSAPFTAIAWTAGIEFDLIALAETYELQTALPALLYRVCRRYSSEDRYEGIRRADGSIAVLSTRHQLMCSIAERCLSSEVCQTFRLRTAVGIGRGAVRALERWDAKWTGAMCAECERRARGMVESGRQEVWKKLPGYFNLRSWQNAIACQREFSNAAGPEPVVKYE
ncbi:hypothetical protein FPV67DRAFT_1668702 [Lyophyllum atratum]|nr:hypothetical protein FPV67DRAFT_1668702 [Lyophyllum atratum]